MRLKNQKNPLLLFQARLDQIISLDHPLCKLAREINWSVFETRFGPYYSESQGRPAKPIRLLVGIHYLKHAFSESDESVAERLLENPYWQYFCGFEYFQHELPIDPTTLVKWRRRVGDGKLGVLLKETIDTAKRAGYLKRGELERVNVDTTVQEKAIEFPTDAGLYQKMRVKLVGASKRREITLRQSYKRRGKEALVKQGFYRRAKQHRRANKMTRKLKTYLGCVVRDIRRKATVIDIELKDLLEKADRILLQEKHSKNKLYSIHAPEVECIAKGKAHKHYEFGCKVGVVSTSQHCWITGVQSFHGNPYDGHTLAQLMAGTEGITSVELKHAHVDKGFRGHNYTGPAQTHITGQGSKKKSRWEKLWRRRRAAVEPVISHAKHDNRMIRNYLKGPEGDEMNAILSACGYNMRKLIRAFFLPKFLVALLLFYRQLSALFYMQYRQSAPVYAIINQ
jgi:IS5 family transposase